MTENKTIKLHLGCADKMLPGWVNIDAAAEFGPDQVHDLSEPLPYEDNIVDVIMAKDLLEHFDKYERHLVAYDWARVLKIGGTINLEVPDFQKILKKFRKFGFDNFVDFIFGENMIRSQYYVGHYGNHKFAYSAETLTNFVELFGIKVKEVKTQALNLHLIGVKTRHVVFDEIEGMLIHSHANSFGDTADLPLSFIKEKIERYRLLAKEQK